MWKANKNRSNPGWWGSLRADGRDSDVWGAVRGHRAYAPESRPPGGRGTWLRAADHTVAFSTHFRECWHPQQHGGCPAWLSLPGVWGHPLQEPLQRRPLPSSSLPAAGARVQLLDSVSWVLPPGKVIKGLALQLVVLEAVKISFLLWGGGTLAQSSALDPAAGTSGI